MQTQNVLTNNVCLLDQAVKEQTFDLKKFYSQIENENSITRNKNVMDISLWLQNETKC